jgi:RHS repeat-associated protein
MIRRVRTGLSHGVRVTQHFLRQMLGTHWRGFTLGFVVLGVGGPAAVMVRPIILPEQPTVAAGPGDTVVVYGPRQFNGSGGSGSTYIERFTVALQPGRKYELTLVNGTPGDTTNRVTSAVTRLNGYQVVGTTDLTRSIASVTKVVAVRQIDTLRITVVGSTGSFVTAKLSSLASSEFVVNGPTTYGIPSGTQKTHTFSFTKAASAGPPFRLYLTNGDSAGGLRVTNASVTLNGTTVVTTQEFTSAIGALTKTVTLNANNNVTVQLKGNASRFVTLWFTATDTTAPVVTITSPPADSVVRTSPITVTGTITDASPTGVTVNGVQATVTNNTSYSASVPITAQGSNTLTAIATDAGGRTSQVTRTVILDSQAPSLTVEAPADNSATKNATATVNATATDATTAVSVNTNGTPLTPGANNSFTGTVALEVGANVLTTTATDAAGNATSVVRNVTRDTLAPVLTVTAPNEGASTTSDSITVSGTVTDDTPVTVAANGLNLPVTSGSFSGKVGLMAGPNTITVIATDAATNSATETRSVTREEPEPDLPPDPSTRATAIKQTEISNLASSTAFLYTGTDPIQTGVAAGTIQLLRAAVIRGKVADRTGAPLGGVQITILNHPEFGQTLSRADGRFDLAVNGGGDLTVNYAKGGHLPAQRTTAVAWQGYSEVDSVILVPLDTAVTPIDFGEATEVARGSLVSDDDGARQATVLFESDNQATMVLPDGSTQPLTTLNVRATEYTVGDQGPAAMPAQLPAASAYTYAVELSVDEAISAGARSVQFTNPVSFYVDNFLQWPVGIIVPVGVYDRSSGKWVAEKDGRVIKILSTNPVQLAVSYPDTATIASQAVLDSLGVSPAELARLGTLYPAGKTIWRVELSHFTSLDLNQPYQEPPKASPPDAPPLPPPPPCQEQLIASVIGCEGQTLGEAIRIAGTSFNLHYQSDRSVGFTVNRQLDMPRQVMVDTAALTAGRPIRVNEFPSHVRNLVYRLEVAGKQIVVKHPRAPIIPATTLRWDGKDVYGRTINAPVRARLFTLFEYQNTLGLSGASGGGGGGVGRPPSFGAPPSTNAIAGVSREAVMLQQIWEGTLGTWDNRTGIELGGWSLSPHHVYDPISGMLYLGSGERRAAATLGNVARIVPPTRGTFCGAISCGIPIFTRSQLGWVATDAAGRLVIPYQVDGAGTSAPGIIRVLGPNGTFVDSIPNAGRPSAVAVAPDGTVYIGEQTSHRIRRWRPGQPITAFAGTGTAGFSGDGGPALSAQLNRPGALALGADGSLFVADENNNRIRRVGPDGTISTYAGNGSTTNIADGGQAVSTPVPAPKGVAVSPDGALVYISGGLVRRVSPSGRVSTVAGFLTGSPGATPATSTFFNIAHVAVAVEPDGAVLFGHGARIWRATLAGTLEVVAGTGSLRCIAGHQSVFCDPRVPSDGDIPAQTKLENVVSVGVAPDGTIYLAETSGTSNLAMVRAIRPALPGLSANNMLIASGDGREVYEFNSAGRHLRTRNAETGKSLLVFDYDGAGRLTAVRDSLENTTTIERTTSGKPSAIVAPFGQRTILTLDANDYLQQVQDPGGNRVRLTHSSTGLLTELRDQRDKVHRFTYDTLGRLVADSAPDGSFMRLARVERDTGYTVTVTTAMNRAQTYALDVLSDKTEQRTLTDAAGFATRSWYTPSAVDSMRAPNGMLTIVNRMGDPRFGAQVSLPGKIVVRLPSNDSMVVTGTRVSVRSDSTNPFSLTQEIDSLRINGQLWRSVYEAATRRMTRTSPEGRQVVTRVDSLGRIISRRTVGLDSVSYQYNSRGRLSQSQSGGKRWTYSYDGSGRLLSTLDPVGRRDSLFYDAADRVTRRVLPGGSEVLFAYDSSGNLTAVTPPTRPVHGFEYTPVDLTSVYTPPNVGLTTPATRYDYNADRQITQITRPDSIALAFGYDGAGRPSSLTFDRGQLGYTYSSTSGNLTSITAPGGNTLSFTYDGGLPKTVTWAGAVQGSVGVGYNADFRVTTMTVNGGNSLTFAYDRDGLLTSAGSLGIKRNAQHGFPERDSLGIVTTVQSHTPRGYPASYTAMRDGATLFQANYVRDSLDRITQVTETVQDTTVVSAFTYDSAGHLAEVSRDGVVTAAYEYDLNGNRTRLTTPGGMVTGTYDAQDRLSTYGSTSYTYGSNGELKTKTDGSGTTTYTYDALGNLTTAVLPNGTQIAYVIDGQNRRVGKMVNGTLVQGLLYQDQLAPVAELDGANVVVSRFVYGSRSHVPDYMIKGPVTYRLISDHLGSVRLVVNTTDGTVAQRIDYDEYGRVTQNTSPGFQPFGFAGGLVDDQTGLVRFGARDYDPAAGRWTAKDPLGFAGGYANLYEYVANDPVNTIDPTGLQALPPNIPQPPPGKDGLNPNPWKAGKPSQPGGRIPYGPTEPVASPKGGQPRVSADPNHGGHIDYNDGLGNPRRRFDPKTGEEVDHYGKPLRPGGPSDPPGPGPGGDGGGGGGGGLGGFLEKLLRLPPNFPLLIILVPGPCFGEVPVPPM